MHHSVLVRPFSLATAASLALALALPAQATDYDWVTDGGDWSDSANWSPDTAVPGPGDTGTIDGLTAVADTALDPVADNIIVRNGGVLSADGELGPDSGTQNVHIQSGSSIELGNGSQTQNFNVTLDDGTMVSVTNTGIMTDTGSEFNINGAVTFRRDMPGTLPGDRAVESRIDADITGTGDAIIEVNQFDQPEDRVTFRFGVTYTGKTIVKSGRLDINNTDRTQGFSSEYQVYDDAHLRFGRNKANEDANLFLFGSDSQLILTEDGTTGDETVFNGLVIGGTPGDPFSGTAVAAGTYTTDDLTGTIMDGRVIRREGRTDPATFRIVNTVPEPASLSLLALGGVMMIGRRRRR